MKNLLSISFSFILLCSLAFAQSANRVSRVSETSTTFAKKATGNALMVTLQGQPKNVNTVLGDLIESQTGTKRKGSLLRNKGLVSFPGVMYRDISNSTMDMHYRVEKASKGDNNNSTVYLFLSAGNNNFYTYATHEKEMQAAQEMLEGLELKVEIYEFKLVIDEQKKLIGKEQKTFTNLVQDSVKLEQKLAETLAAIEQNKIDRANQILKIEDEEKRLDEFRLELARLEGGEPAVESTSDELTPIIESAKEEEGEKKEKGSGGKLRR